MKRRFFSRIAAPILLLSTSLLQAAVIVVSPGTGTLETAVNAASGGDTLELVTGIYDGASFNIGKSLIIRAQDAAQSPVIVVPGPSADAAGLNLLWQGIEFRGSGPSQNSTLAIGGGDSEFTFQGCIFSDMLLSVLSRTNAEFQSVRILESEISDAIVQLSCGGSQLTCGRSAAFVGNNINFQNSASFLRLFVTQSLIFAGNTLTSSRVANDFRFAGEPMQMIGNQFDFSTATDPRIQVIGNLNTLSGRATIIGNRIDLRFDTSFGSVTDLAEAVDVSSSGKVEFRNNLVRVIDNAALAIVGPGSKLDGVRAIVLDGGSVSSQISNNVFDYGGSEFGGPEVADNGVIQLETSATVENNIFAGVTTANVTFSPASIPFNQFRNNLCFNTLNSCTNLDGNQDGDPLFVDLVDYRLGPGSPAIDAGPDNPFVIDADGSRSDLGVYGGQFPIDQFDIQRTPGRTAPFIYPQFSATEDLDEFGNINVKVIGIARQR